MQEPNFHALYLELMEHMNKPMMDKHLASTTFKYIKILLRSERIKTQVGRQQLLHHSHGSFWDNSLETFVLSWCLLQFTLLSLGSTAINVHVVSISSAC